MTRILIGLALMSILLLAVSQGGFMDPLPLSEEPLLFAGFTLWLGSALLIISGGVGLWDDAEHYQYLYEDCALDLQFCEAGDDDDDEIAFSYDLEDPTILDLGLFEKKEAEPWNVFYERIGKTISNDLKKKHSSSMLEG